MPLHTNTARMDLTFSLAERFTESGQREGQVHAGGVGVQRHRGDLQVTPMPLHTNTARMDLTF
ncbi:hypothetical protein MAHJHV54_47360 [Mycobacterium avium subsp. hominissuis]